MSFTPTPINPTTDTVKPSPFIAFTQRVIPATFDQTLSYQEALYALLNYINKLGETVNENAEVTDAQTKVIDEMTDYLNNYFDNLDVQEEINNKLDEMADDGTLQAIIESYINLNAVIVYDNLAALKASEALVAGVTVKTLGYHTKGDGGSAIYRIREVTNQDTEDDMLIVAITNDVTLVAEFIFGDDIVPQQLGAYGNGTNEDSVSIAKTFEVAASKAIPINLRGVYYINNPISIDSEKAIIVNGSRPQIGSTISESTDTFANFKFGNDGYFKTLNVTNVTFNSVGFNGTNKAIVLRSFRNRIINCGFNGFNEAISTEEGTNWTGENQILNCTFNSVTTCIKLNYGSDGDINGCLADGTCTNFIISNNADSGYKIQNNHDYSTSGSVLYGYNMTFVGNYIDGWNKLTINANSGFNITGNTFIGVQAESGVNCCIKLGATSIAGGLISSNIVTNSRNDLVNDYTYFIDMTSVTNAVGLTIGNNLCSICKSLFYGAILNARAYTLINQTIKNNTAASYDAHMTITSQNIQLNGSICTGYITATLDGALTADSGINLPLDMGVGKFIFHVKLNNETSARTIIQANNRIKPGGNYNAASSVEIYFEGIRENYKCPALNTAAA